MPNVTTLPDPQLDLVFERVVPLPPETIWRAWTTPEQIKVWFTPAPWRTVDCVMDLRPGGIFHTVMRSPEGQDFPNEGCFLEIVPNRKLVWTNALQPGFRPCSTPAPGTPDCGMFKFTAMLSLEPHAQGTHYRATVKHADAEGRKQHEAMGFHEGWGKALDQLVAMAQPS